MEPVQRDICDGPEAEHANARGRNAIRRTRANKAVSAKETHIGMIQDAAERHVKAKQPKWKCLQDGAIRGGKCVVHIALSKPNRQLFLSSLDTQKPPWPLMSLTSSIEQVAERYTALRVTVGDGGKTRLKGPLPYHGHLDKHEHIDITPVIGRQYGADLQLSELLQADEATLRDLAHIGESRALPKVPKHDRTADLKL